MVYSLGMEPSDMGSEQVGVGGGTLRCRLVSNRVRVQTDIISVMWSFSALKAFPWVEMIVRGF